MNTDALKKPEFWAIAVPALLVLWAIVLLATMLTHRSTAHKHLAWAQQAHANSQRILTIRERFGQAAALGAAAGNFRGLQSAVECARLTGITTARIFRADSGTRPQRQKDGSMLHRETYKINGVDLLRVARFIDTAERSYPALNCTTLTLARARSNTKDFWDAVVGLEYLVK